MAFDQPTRNRLQRFVTESRELLSNEFTRQLQHEYGLDPSSGSVTPIDDLKIDDSRLETARILRDTMEHYLAGSPSSNKKEILERIVREQAFTVLNRLAALRMAEARGILLESLTKGYSSKGFQLYTKLAGTGLGETGDSYRSYLFSVFDEFAPDLRVLFDRFSPSGRLFPRESVLLELLAVLNSEDIASLWAEDETIGWVYQYFNSPQERKKMREESAAPRTSRELAVRNQFFTPRYVVEFLTDNTLGRIWYEMTRGETKLNEQCRYLVKRRHPIFLASGQNATVPYDPKTGLRDDPGPAREMWTLPNRLLTDLQDIFRYALTFDGYDYAKEHLGMDCSDLANGRLSQFREAKKWEGTFEELRCCLFFEQRRHRHVYQDSDASDEEVQGVLQLYHAVSDAWYREVEQIPHRPLKDPRTVLMLDPACGSMHFGLYAYDLFETIYDEAWELEENLGADVLKRPGEMKSLHDTYAGKEAFLRDVPRLIIEHNLHGIDIDPRCAQIAGLSLWLRAQKAWQRLSLKPAERPVIRRSNIVCAEPMPGEKELLRDFVEKEFRVAERGVFLPLLEAIFDKMQLAGEAGSLLKIEEEIRSAIAGAAKLWKAGPHLEQAKLFRELESAKQKELDLTGVTDEQFWDSAEGRIYDALRDYAQQAENGGGFQRHLFAEDAARGFSFIDVCRKHYDVMLMNPPFGETTKNAKPYIDRQFPYTKNDFYAAFVDEGLQRLVEFGLLGAITSRTGLFLGSYQAWREQVLLKEARPIALADLGYGVLDAAMVETAAYILERLP